MSSDWIAGVFGVGGVVVGGLLTAGADAVQAHRSNRARAKVAARLLRRELMTVASSVSTAVRQGTWGPTRRLDTAAWDEYGDVLALSLRPDEWLITGNTVTQIRRTGGPTIELHAAGWERNVIHLAPEVVEVLRPLYDDCRRAFSALHRVSQEPEKDHELPTIEELAALAAGA